MSETDNPEDWRKLVEQIYVEKDHMKLKDLVRRLGLALDKDQVDRKSVNKPRS
jgi:hypothetical protein